MEEIIQRIADETCLKINYACQTMQPTTKMPYPNQYILEEVIKILKEKV